MTTILPSRLHPIAIHNCNCISPRHISSGFRAVFSLGLTLIHLGLSSLSVIVSVPSSTILRGDIVLLNRCHTDSLSIFPSDVRGFLGCS